MGISVTKLLIILAIALVFFGTKRLKNVGSDLGEAIKNFRTAIKEGEQEETSTPGVTETKSTSANDKH